MNIHPQIKYIFSELTYIIDELKTKDSNGVLVSLVYNSSEDHMLKNSIEIERNRGLDFGQVRSSLGLYEDDLIFDSNIDDLNFCIPIKEISFILWLMEEIVKYNLTTNIWN